MIEHVLPWLILAGLGALHGINPGMGWLFAVALGLQEADGRAVWRALLPLATGHALAIAAAVLAASIAGLVLRPEVVRWIVVLTLCAFGGLRLVRQRHPQTCGLRVTARDLTIWSFLMASAHGAGLMVLPVLLRTSHQDAASCCVTPHPHGTVYEAGVAFESVGLLATVAHTTGYLLVSGMIATMVYRRFGLRLLRTWWFNFDVAWAATLVITALLTAIL